MLMEKRDGEISIEVDMKCALIADTPNTSIEGCAKTNGNHSLGRGRQDAQRLPYKGARRGTASYKMTEIATTSDYGSAL